MCRSTEARRRRRCWPAGFELVRDVGAQIGGAPPARVEIFGHPRQGAAEGANLVSAAQQRGVGQRCRWIATRSGHQAFEWPHQAEREPDHQRQRQNQLVDEELNQLALHDGEPPDPEVRPRDEVQHAAVRGRLRQRDEERLAPRRQMPAECAASGQRLPNLGAGSPGGRQRVGRFERDEMIPRADQVLADGADRRVLERDVGGARPCHDSTVAVERADEGQAARGDACLGRGIGGRCLRGRPGELVALPTGDCPFIGVGGGRSRTGAIRGAPPRVASPGRAARGR